MGEGESALCCRTPEVSTLLSAGVPKHLFQDWEIRGRVSAALQNPDSQSSALRCHLTCCIRLSNWIVFMKFPFCSLLPASSPAAGNDVVLLGHLADRFCPRSLDAEAPISSSVTFFVPGTLTQESHTFRKQDDQELFTPLTSNRSSTFPSPNLGAGGAEFWTPPLPHQTRGWGPRKGNS